MAEVRQHFADGFHLSYGLPANPDYDTPRVYFHPQTLLLDALEKFMGIEPGWIYAALRTYRDICLFSDFHRPLRIGRWAQLRRPVSRPAAFFVGTGTRSLMRLRVQGDRRRRIADVRYRRLGANLGLSVIYGVEAYTRCNGRTTRYLPAGS
jgi:hypothetical protein